LIRTGCRSEFHPKRSRIGIVIHFVLQPVKLSIVVACVVYVAAVDVAPVLFTLLLLLLFGLSLDCRTRGRQHVLLGCDFRQQHVAAASVLHLCRCLLQLFVQVLLLLLAVSHFRAFFADAALQISANVAPVDAISNVFRSSDR